MLIINDTMDQMTIATNMRGVVDDHNLIRARDQDPHGDMQTSIEVAEEKGLVRENG